MHVYLYMYRYMYEGWDICIHVVGSSPTRGSSFFLGIVTALGVLCCLALFVCLFDLACFFLSHLSSLIKTCIYIYEGWDICILVHVHVVMVSMSLQHLNSACAAVVVHVVYSEVAS